MEQALLGLSLILGTIWISDTAKTLPVRFVLGNLPLTIVEPVALNVNLFGVPVLSIAWLQKEGNIILIKKCLVGEDKFSTLVHWFPELSDLFSLNHLSKSSTSNCSFSPLDQDFLCL